MYESQVVALRADRAKELRDLKNAIISYLEDKTIAKLL